jgi:hypothetical protein
MSKTVFILGAGFSKNAGIPTQNEIFNKMPSSFKHKYKESYEGVVEFYTHIFKVKDKRNFSKIPLEDVFTFMDRAISSGEKTSWVPLSRMLTVERKFLQN